MNFQNLLQDFTWLFINHEGNSFFLSKISSHSLLDRIRGICPHYIFYKTKWKFQLSSQQVLYLD